MFFGMRSPLLCSEPEHAKAGRTGQREGRVGPTDGRDEAGRRGEGKMVCWPNVSGRGKKKTRGARIKSLNLCWCLPPPVVRGRPEQPIGPTWALRSSSRSSSAASRGLWPRRSIGSGGRRRSCTKGGRMSSCPDPSRKPGSTGIPSDKQRNLRSPWSVAQCSSQRPTYQYTILPKSFQVTPKYR